MQIKHEYFNSTMDGNCAALLYILIIKVLILFGTFHPFWTTSSLDTHLFGKKKKKKSALFQRELFMADVCINKYMYSERQKSNVKLGRKKVR